MVHQAHIEIPKTVRRHVTHVYNTSNKMWLHMSLTPLIACAMATYYLNSYVYIQNAVSHSNIKLRSSIKPACFPHVYSAGCSPPTPPVNGSVSEFTSSRVGAQVTYLCDTDLVLVGERVATCSSPSLQWLPSSEEVMCVQPPGKSRLDDVNFACTA